MLRERARELGSRAERPERALAEESFRLPLKGAVRCVSRLARVVAAAIFAAAMSRRAASAVELESIAKARRRLHESAIRSCRRCIARRCSTRAVRRRSPPDGTAYVKTGDIPAEWLRDASAQVRPYLFFAKTDPQVAPLLRGDHRAHGQVSADRSVRERVHARLSRVGREVRTRFARVSDHAGVDVLERRPATRRSSPAICRSASTRRSRRWSASKITPRNSNYTHKEMPQGGKGNPVGYTGMIWTGFRPSDDACTYNFLIPSEMMAVVALGELAEIERDVYHNLIKAQRATALRDEVQTGIQTYGVVFTPNYGYIYAYEVDGLGHAILMDDANIPSLLSAPYIGYTKATELRLREHAAFLALEGQPDVLQRASRARDRQPAHERRLGVAAGADHARDDRRRRDTERTDVLTQLLASDPGDHLLHESFNPDDPTQIHARRFRLAERALLRVRDDRSSTASRRCRWVDTSDLDFRGE